MPYVSDQCLKEQLSVASAIRELAADYLLGALSTIEYRRRLRELVASYPRPTPSTTEPGCTAQHA